MKRAILIALASAGFIPASVVRKPATRYQATPKEAERKMRIAMDKRARKAAKRIRDAKRASLNAINGTEAYK